MDGIVTDAGSAGAVLLYDGCTIAEVIDVATRLSDAGVLIDFVAPSAAEICDRSGLRMAPDRALADVEPTSFGVVVVPGGNPDSIIHDTDVLDWLALAGEGDACVAAICAGVALVAAAGLAAGRRITHNYRAPWAPSELAGAVDHLWSDAEVEPDRTVLAVRDGDLVTALPNATVEFTMEVLVALDIHDRRHAAMLARHLHGEVVDDLYPPF